MSWTLYRYYNEDGDLLYIGVTHCFATRDDDHRHNAAWFKHKKSSKTEEHPTEAAARTAEWIAIGAEKPKHNVARKPALSPNWKMQLLVVHAELIRIKSCCFSPASVPPCVNLATVNKGGLKQC